MAVRSKDCEDSRHDQCTGYTNVINQECVCPCHTPGFDEPPGGDLHDCSQRGPCYCHKEAGD